MKWRSFLVKLLLITFFIGAQSFASIPQHKDFLAATTNSQKELMASRELHTVLQGLRRDRLIPSTTQSLLNLSKKNVGFNVYVPLITAAHQIALFQGKYQKFFSICDAPMVKLSNDSLPTMGDRILKDLQSYCRGLFLTHLNKSKKRLFTLSDPELAYLEQSTPHFVSSEHLDAFTKFLQKIEAGTELHSRLSEIVTRSVIKDKITPPKEILSNIAISQELTEHIQKNGLFDHTAVSFFKSEFRKMDGQISLLINNEKFSSAKAQIDATKVFYQQNEKYIAQYLAWNTFERIGRRLLYKKQFELAKVSFKYAIEISDNSQREESIFYYIWADIVQKNYKSAYNSISELGLLNNKDTQGSKLKYWVARVLGEVGKKQESLLLFENISQIDPLSFYTILSIKELSKSNPTQTSVQVRSKMRAPSAFEDFSGLKASSYLVSTLKRLSMWLDLGLDTYSHYEIKDILDSRPEQLFKDISKDVDQLEFEKFIVSELTKLFNTKNKYLHTFRLVHNSLNKDHFELNSEVISSLYPMDYFEDIKKIASDIDPLVILSLIRQESAFNESARSVAGARGLMQLMPATARQLQRNLRVHQLYQPSLNIRLGTRYFTRLLKKYDGDLIDTLAAYNAGQGNLRKWKENIFFPGEDDPMVRIEMIPFKETRKYVKLIYRNMFYYRLMTNDPQLSETLAETLKIELN